MQDTQSRKRLENRPNAIYRYSGKLKEWEPAQKKMLSKGVRLLGLDMARWYGMA